jgi:hypothetical protein
MDQQAHPQPGCLNLVLRYDDPARPAVTLRHQQLLFFKHLKCQLDGAGADAEFLGQLVSAGHGVPPPPAPQFAAQVGRHLPGDGRKSARIHAGKPAHNKTGRQPRTVLRSVSALGRKKAVRVPRAPPCRDMREVSFGSNTNGAVHAKLQPQRIDTTIAPGHNLHK